MPGMLDNAWHRPLQEVYQCTEGFLAASCPHGRLHLNEEHVHIEPQWLDAGQQRFMPVITDFSRRTQAFVRYRLDDVLRMDAEQDCPCGRHTRTIAAIEGRQDDVLWLPDVRNDALTALFPDSLRRAMLLAQDCFSDYRLEQHALTWLVRLQPMQGVETEQAESADRARACRALPAVATAASRARVCALATSRARDAGPETTPHTLPAKTHSGKGDTRMNILVTGASGFVGSSFMRQFAAVPNLRLYGRGTAPFAGQGGRARHAARRGQLPVPRSQPTGRTEPAAALFAGRRHSRRGEGGSLGQPQGFPAR